MPLSFAEKHLEETPDVESVAEVASPKKNKRDESDDEEEDRAQSPVSQSPKRKKQLDTCECVSLTASDNNPEKLHAV